MMIIIFIIIVFIIIAFIISLLAYISDVPTRRSTFRVAYQLYPVMLRSVSPKVATPMRAPRPNILAAAVLAPPKYLLAVIPVVYPYE